MYTILTPKHCEAMARALSCCKDYSTQPITQCSMIKEEKRTVKERE